MSRVVLDWPLATLSNVVVRKIRMSLKLWWTNLMKGKIFQSLASYTFKWAASWQNQQNGMCAQRTLRSAWESAQSDQSLLCPHEESLGPKLPNVRTAKTLIRLGGCPGWSDSSLSAQSFCWFCHEAAQISNRGVNNHCVFASPGFIQRYNLELGLASSCINKSDWLIPGKFTYPMIPWDTIECTIRHQSSDVHVLITCSIIAETQYETVKNKNCIWICPKCEFFNFSDPSLVNRWTWKLKIGLFL